MIKTILFFAGFILRLIGTVPELLKARGLVKEGKDKEAFLIGAKVGQRFGNAALKSTGGEFIVEGLENIPDENCVFIGNHQSDFDIALMLALANKPLGFVAKKEMKKVPILREWMEILKCSFMDRESPRKSMEAIVEAIDSVKKGYTLVIYPEGTRNKGYLDLEFKPGSFKLATKPGAVLVPVVVEGSYKLFEANNKRIKPAKVKLKFLEAINTKALSKEELEKLPSKVEALIKDEVLRLREN
ncbi:MAG: lysophospholipid acyltransferase family protein [Clostridiaceae bacterium]